MMQNGAGENDVWGRMQNCAGENDMGKDAKWCK